METTPPACVRQAATEVPATPVKAPRPPRPLAAGGSGSSRATAVRINLLPTFDLLAAGVDVPPPTRPLLDAGVDPRARPRPSIVGDDDHMGDTYNPEQSPPLRRRPRIPALA